MGENSEQCSGVMVMVPLPYGKFKGKKLLSLGRARIHNSDCFDLNSVLLFLKTLCNGCFIVPASASGRGRTGPVLLAPFRSEMPLQGGAQVRRGPLLPVLCTSHDCSFVACPCGHLFLMPWGCHLAFHEWMTAINTDHQGDDQSGEARLNAAGG